MATIYSLLTSRNRAINDARNLMQKEAEAFANYVKSELNTDMGVVRSLANGFAAYDNYASEEARTMQETMMKNIFRTSTNYLALWVSWELYAIDSTYTKSHGRETLEFFFSNGEVKSRRAFRDLDSPNEGSMYYSVKINPQELITDPYYYSYNSEDSILEASISAPIMHYNLFAGIVGVDVSLARFYDLIKNIKPFKNSIAFLVSNNGTIIAHPQKEYVGKSIKEAYPNLVKNNKLDSKIKQGVKVELTANVENLLGKQYIYIAPFYIGKSKIPWSVGLFVPEKGVVEQGDKAFIVSLIIGIIGLFILVLFITIVMNRLVAPVEQSTFVLNKVNDGIINENLKIKVNQNDEFGLIAKAVNNVVDLLIRVLNYTQEISKGNLSAQFTPKSQNDILGITLKNMQRNLERVKEEEEKRKQEQAIRSWISEGLAKIGNIVRQDYKNIDELANNSLSNLVKYIDATTGALFMINEDDPDNLFMELIVTFAYERDIAQNHKIFNLEEGLIGRVSKSKEILIVEDIPESYLTVKSGLGSAPPKYLILVPILQQNKLLGIIEISNFRKFKDYEIEFLQNISQSFANSISSYFHQKQTQQLLNQQKEQARKLKENEEKVLAALERLKEQQAESQKQEAELESFINAIKESVFVVIYSPEGEIIELNDKFAQFLGIDAQKYIGTKQGATVIETSGNYDRNKLWSDLLEHKKKITVTQMIVVDGKKFKLLSTYSPILDEKGNVEQIINISIEIKD